MDSVSTLIMSVSMLGLAGICNYLIFRLATFTQWQKDLIDSLAELSEAAIRTSQMLDETKGD